MIRLDQPRKWDIVGDPILIAGVGTGFEATFAYRITEGHDEIVDHIMAGGGTGEHGQFQKRVKVGDAAFKLDRLFVEVFEFSARDGEEINKTSREVLYGPLLVPDYYGYREHLVKEGDTLSSISRYHYGETKLNLLIRANPKLPNPDLIAPGDIVRVPIGF
jgi:nucleoid-associated protein YgaU